MNAAVAAPALATRPVRRAARRARLSFPGVLRGEWIKLLSLRSTWWTLGLTIVLMTLFAFGLGMSLDLMAEDPATAPALDVIHGAEIVASGYQLGMLSIAVLGALLITGEYSTGMIRSTLAAVPTRVPVLAAKAIALTVVTAAVGLVSLVLSFTVTSFQLREYDLVPRLDDAATWQVFGGMTYALVAAALFALGVGVLLRSTAGTVAVSLTVLLLLPSILGFITLDWVETIVRYLPLPAAAAFLTVSESPIAGHSKLAPWTGVAVIAAWALVPLVAGAVVLRRRDA
ncbi:ABC transporter permease subunit [Georgenia yuyongxinii]|uniref:ABC transporter permease subunit n=1 Tax=Georgenia yuyongxinii TaxID=2589797 RepID=A0A552WTA7_9MICO|nr:ABC transporter permease subunit [Georgenia yuyongxinii]TRW46052.1 ABC transporter permease subunit [Georgenia yuyongxinii]